MIDGNNHIKINHSDKLIETIRQASGNMSFDEYVKATGLDKDFIFDILKGHVEEVDQEKLKKLSLKH
jgi:hypothetical protein